MFDIYVCGPMTGIPNKNYPAFNKATAELRSRGYSVVNPAEIDSTDMRDSWEESLRRDIDKLVQCKYIATLPGWEDSRGCKLETYIGKSLSMKIQSVDKWLQKEAV